MISPTVIEYLRQAGPTVEGMKRYAPTGFYGDAPCMCDSRCPIDCEGDCGCEACETAALDEGVVRA